jgi:hypothetical protein
MKQKQDEKGKVEETDKVALKIKQEVLKEMCSEMERGDKKRCANFIGMIGKLNKSELKTFDWFITETKNLAISKTRQSEGRKCKAEKESAVRRAKLDSMEFHTKNMNELLAKKDGDTLRFFNKIKEDLKQQARATAISEVRDLVQKKRDYIKKFVTDENNCGQASLRGKLYAYEIVLELTNNMRWKNENKKTM